MTAELMNLAEKNLKAEIFSAPVVADELERMGKEKHAQIADIAKEIYKRKPNTILYFGSGGSSSALFSGYWAALSLLKQPVSYLLAPDIIASSPAILDENCVAIGASYSGKTVDTLRAQRWLLERNVPLFSITRRPDAELAKGATWSMTYESIALYSSPAYTTMHSPSNWRVCAARDRRRWTSLKRPCMLFRVCCAGAATQPSDG